MALTTRHAPASTGAGRPVAIHGQDTLPKLFRHVVRERGDRVAMREKHLGIWRAISWREYDQQARRVGLGLVALAPPATRSRSATTARVVYTDLGGGGRPNG
jgi:long-chain acyl-CoA synthetase